MAPPGRWKKWRRGRDSNPGWGLIAPQQISNLPLSTAQPPLRIRDRGHFEKDPRTPRRRTSHRSAAYSTRAVSGSQSDSHRVLEGAPDSVAVSRGLASPHESPSRLLRCVEELDDHDSSQERATVRFHAGRPRCRWLRGPSPFPHLLPAASQGGTGTTKLSSKGACRSCALSPFPGSSGSAKGHEIDPIRRRRATPSSSGRRVDRAIDDPLSSQYLPARRLPSRGEIGSR